MLESLIEQQLRQACEELVRRVRDGETKVAESLLQTHSVLAEHDDRAVELVYTEFVTCEELGQEPQAAAFYERFPKLRERLKRLFEIHQTLSIDDVPVTRPEEPPGPIPGYRVVRRLGSGGMGTVYLADQLSVKRPVALKVLHPHISEDLKIIKRFHREAVTLGMLSHPNIASIHASGVENGVHFLAVEYCQGESLQTLLDQREKDANSNQGPATDDWCQFVLKTSIQVAGAISYAHSHGVLHRDIKPSNVIVNADTSEVWVVDFGLAKVLESDEETLTIGPLGTPLYSSPEQLKGNADERSDICSFGLMLKRLLSQPVGQDSALDWAEDVDRNIRSIVRRATEIEPELRYQSMDTVQSELQAVADGKPPNIAPAGPFRRAFVRAKQNKVAVSVATALAIVITIFGFLYAVERDKSRKSSYDNSVNDAVMKLHAGQISDRFLAGTRLFVSAVSEVPDLVSYDPQSRFEAALVDINRAIDSYRSQPEAYYYRARILLSLGRSLEAETDLTQALVCDPTFIPARVLVAKLRGSAVALSTDELPADDLDWHTHWLSCHTARTESDWVGATRAHGRLIDSKEPFSGCHVDNLFGRVAAFLETRQYESIIEDMAVLRAQWPLDSEPTLLLAKAYIGTGDDQRAGEVLSQRYSVYPTAATILGIAGIYLSSDRADDGLAWLEKIEDEYLRALVHAVALNHKRRYVESEAVARKLLISYPDRAPVLVQLASALVNLGKFSEAKQFAQRATELRPDNYFAHLHHGAALLMLDDVAAAKSAFDKSIQLRPNDPHAYRNAANRLRLYGRNEEAAALMHDAIRVDPLAPGSHVTLGLICEGLGRVEEATEHHKRAIHLAPGVGSYHECLGRLYHRQRMWCEGLREYVTAIELNAALDESVVSLLNGLRLPGSHLKCKDGSFHDLCGGSDYFFETFERITVERRDNRLLTILILAYCQAPSRIDQTKAGHLVMRAMEATGNDVKGVHDAATKLLKIVVDRSALDIHALELIPSLPAFAAIDAILDSQGVVDEGDRKKVIQRFAPLSQFGESAIRLSYLQACLDQQSGQYEEASERFLEIASKRSDQPEPVLHTIQCIRMIGDAEMEVELRDRVNAIALESSSHRDTRTWQWDFDRDLTATTDGPPLRVTNVKPAKLPQISFERKVVHGGQAHVAHFSRGTCFEMELGPNPLHNYTLIIDVCFEFNSRQRCALLRRDHDADADWMIHRKLGVGKFQFDGRVDDNAWYRLALVVQPTSSESKMTSYIDGRRVQTTAFSQDVALGRYSLKSRAVLFADDSQENASGWVNSVQLRCHAMTPAEIAALGAPQAQGIPLPIEKN